MPDDIRADLNARADALLVKGLRNHWYCIGPSALVADKPVPIMRLGEKLVLWRDAAGKPHLQADLCPHRNAPLSQGFVKDGLLTCAYHGVQIDGAGCVAGVPAFPPSNLAGQKLVRTYPVVEHFQGLWAYFGDGEPVPLELPEELTSTEWAGYICSATWRTSWLYILENLSDPMHTPYLHAETFTMQYGQKHDEVVIDEQESGFLVTRKYDPSSNIEQMFCHDRGAFWNRIGVFYPPAGGPGGYLRIIATACPIDERASQINFWRLRKVSGWQRDMWRFLFQMKLEQFAWDAIDEDRVLLEGMPDWPPAAENLYQHDLGVARTRRRLRRAAERQLGGR